MIRRAKKDSMADLPICTSNSQVDLGIAVQKACENVTLAFRFLYPLDISIKEKIEAIAGSYGASGVEYSEQIETESSGRRWVDQGFIKSKEIPMIVIKLV
ncbi:hypothetical protein IFM89_032434 [Coptis chinensis]|uniref:Uncharacterized protein n=1 Tax=Coptis chinensis TaxID=261450 RepID=A0A835I6S5_9MAGN|nr:hypothetical protein IFM89_032434 [Coptis chinensis]